MKLNIYLIGAFFGMFILASCDNDDDETPVPKDDSWYWGYFKGEINGKEISLEKKLILLVCSFSKNKCISS